MDSATWCRTPAAQRVADQARQAKVERLAHVSGIGSDAGSSSLYIRKRGEGELAVRAAFTDAILIRPAVMFGPDDSLLTSILKLLGRLPIYPMFGRGLTRLQPAYVEDVAEAISRIMAFSIRNRIFSSQDGSRQPEFTRCLPIRAEVSSRSGRFRQDGAVAESSKEAHNGGGTALLLAAFKRA